MSDEVCDGMTVLLKKIVVNHSVTGGLLSHAPACFLLGLRLISVIRLGNLPRESLALIVVPWKGNSR
jgi:hypothetical protein